MCLACSHRRKESKPRDGTFVSRLKHFCHNLTLSSFKMNESSGVLTLWRVRASYETLVYRLAGRCIIAFPAPKPRQTSQLESRYPDNKSSGKLLRPDRFFTGLCPGYTITPHAAPCLFAQIDSDALRWGYAHFFTSYLVSERRKNYALNCVSGESNRNRRCSIHITRIFRALFRLRRRHGAIVSDSSHPTDRRTTNLD